MFLSLELRYVSSTRFGKVESSNVLEHKRPVAFQLTLHHLHQKPVPTILKKTNGFFFQRSPPNAPSAMTRHSARGMVGSRWYVTAFLGGHSALRGSSAGQSRSRRQRSMALTRLSASAYPQQTDGSDLDGGEFPKTRARLLWLSSTRSDRPTLESLVHSVSPTLQHRT